MKKLLTLCLALIVGAGIAFGAVPEDHFRFISNQDGSSVGLAMLSSHQTLEFSTDGNNWSNMTTETTISLNNGITLYVRGKLTDNNSLNDYTSFSITGKVSVKGNVNYVWDYEDLNAPLKEFCGYHLFDSNSVGLTDASELSLPSTTLANSCYRAMFYQNSNIIIAPTILPATTLTDSCYTKMFKECSNLLATPELPATTLAPCCCYEMFASCIKLISTPDTLSAMILAKSCYKRMFNSCTSLRTAPVLPATTLAEMCYQEMFTACSSLSNAPSSLPATTLADFCYWSMFHSCNLTTPPSLPATTLTEGCYAYMFKNNTNLTTAPTLPAKTLAERCYVQMFWGCSKLNYIKCLATNISATSCTENWVKGVASSGTFVSHKSMSSWTTGVNGKPSGWSTSTVTPYTISFDANGGIIPTEGNMGSAIDKQVTSLSSDQKTGFVIVTSGQTTFSKMRNDCPTRAGHTFLGWYTAKTGGTQVYDELGVYVSGSYWDGDGKWKGTSDLQLYAHWEAQICTITWLQDDGTLIDKTSVPYGQIPTHVSPIKESTAEYTYTFAGWNPEIVAVTGDATYTATYTATHKTFTITWLQDDGSLIDKTAVEYGQMPTHADPTKAETAEYTYTFNGWAPEIVAATDNATYIATYTSNRKSYTITWLQDDGSLIDKTTVEYGHVPTHADPTKEPDAQYIYTFAGWTPSVVAVVGEATYTATYSTLPNTEGIEYVDTPSTPHKILRDGQVFILRGDKTYTLTGQEVK